MAAREVVSAPSVSSAAGGTAVQATFVQKAGLWLAGGVGGTIAFVAAGTVVFLYAHYPAMPSTESLRSPADAKLILEQYRELAGVAVKSAQDLFQTVVTQTLLPVLTAILGYIFARGGREDAGS